jgi:hypothetical protein
MDDLQKLYDLLVREGKYTKSFDEFKVKWGSEQGYQDKVFDVVSRDGFYTKDKGSFMSKFGGTQPSVEGQEIKKKEQASAPLPEENVPSSMEFPSGVGKLVLPKPIRATADATATKPIMTEPVPVKKEEQGWLLNMVSSIDKGAYNLPGEAVKGVGTLLEGVTGKGFVSDALKKFGSSYLKAIEELTPQDESFKNTLSDQFGQAFGQVAGMVLTGGASQAAKTTTALSAAEAALASQSAPKALTIGGAVKKFASELSQPASVGMGLAMGQGEFERAKQAGATDDQAFEAFYKNAVVGSVLENIPVMQFLKRFNKASAGGVANYLKTKAIGGLTGGTEEMTTEVLQQLYANQTAQDIYNINQDLFEGVGESGGIGFGVGFLLNAMGANAKLLRKQGKNDEADVIENQMTQFANAPQAPAGPPPTYSVAGVKITDPVVINDMIDKMDVADLVNSNIEITNDPELNTRLQDKIVTSSIKEQVRESNPNLTEEQLDEVTNLEKELRKFEGNTTQSGKDKAASIRSQIKTIQENAIQEQTAGEVPVQSGAGVSETLAEGEPQAGPEVVAEEVVTPKEEVVSLKTQEVAPVVSNPLENIESTAKALEGLNTVEIEAPLLQYIAAGSMIGKTSNQVIAEEYHKAKQDGSNPELVNAVEQLVSSTTQEESAIGEYNPTEEVKSKDMDVLNEVLTKKKVQPEAEPDITDFGDTVVFEYYDSSIEGDFVTRLTFKKNKNGEIVGRGVKVEKGANRIKETKFFENFVSSQTQATQEVAPVVEVEQYVPIIPKQITNEKFTRDNAIDYEEGERETDSGRTVTYLASLTVEAQDDNGDTVGSLTKITDEDGIVSWNSADIDGNELSLDGFDSKDEAKKALVDKVNKDRKKEFDKEAKKKAKAKEKKSKFAKDETVRPQPTGDRTGRTEGSTITPLEDTPSVPGVNGPDPQLIAVAEQYAKDNGIPFKRQAEYVKVDEKRAKRIADAYEAMANDPQNPKVKEAYQNLIKQTIAQYEALVKAGYKFWFMDLNIPSNADYASTPYNAIRDLRKNKEMGVFATTDGYGESGLTELDVENNPLLADTGIQWGVGGLDGPKKNVLANDLFRAVHDTFGHGIEGSGFRARGEENAWQAHVRLFTGSAIDALTSETRGQNSWLNYGPNGEKNRTAKVEDTVFAEQKVGLMPEWVSKEGRAEDMKPAKAKPTKEAPTTKKTKAAPEEGPTAEDLSSIEAMLDLDMDNEDNMLMVLNALDRADKALDKRLFGQANNFLLAFPLGTASLVVKSIKVLVKGGMMLRDAIRKVAADNNISQDSIKDIINIAPIQDGFNALMDKVGAMIERQTSRGTEEKKMVSNIDTLVRNSEVYQNANDAQKKILEREARTQAGAIERRAPSIGRILGVLKDITNVSIKDKLKIISEIRQLSKDAANSLAKEIKELATQGKITVNQAANIVSRFGKVNMLSEISVSKFVDYMTKVFNDAEYASKLGTAKSLKKDIKKLSKDKNKNANLRDLSQKFSEIDPSMVENIDAYNEMASKIKEAIKGSTIRGQKVSLADMVNIDDATEYINKTLDAQDKMMREEKAAEIQSLMGIDVSEFSYDDMMMLLESKEPITKYNEGIIRSTINKAFNVFSSLIKETISTGKDPFTGEDVEFTKSQKDIVKRFMDMDLSLLKPKEALQAVDALANFLQNKSTAKMETVVSEYTGIKNAKELSDKGVKAYPLQKYWSQWLGKFLGEQVTNINVLFERMFKGFERGGMVMDKMGFTKLINKKSFGQTQSNNIVEKYVSQFYKKTANGEAFNSEYNNIERGLAAFVTRSVVGTEQQMTDEFDRRKGLVQESIQVLSEGNDKEQAKAEIYQKAYDKIVTDSENIKDVLGKVDKTNSEAIEFWKNEWSEKYEQLSDVSLNVYNKVLDKDLNYTPDRFVKLSSDTGVVELDNEDSAFHTNNGTLYQRETGVLMTATRPDSLPKDPKSGDANRYIDLSFDSANANAMYDALIDINTAAPIRQIQSFLNSSYFKKIVPNADNAKILKDRIKLYVGNIRNKNPYSNDELSNAVKGLNKIAAIGVGQALGGVTQPLKQVIPVAMNTVINAGGLDVASFFDANKMKFLMDSGYAIANRGVESQAQIESINKLLEEAAKSKGQKALNLIEQANKKWIDIFLVKPDVFIAKVSWMTYYEQSLKKQGIETKNIDYSKHELNEEAANYAQRMVDRQQNVSDSDLAGKLFSNKESSNQLLVKTLMPFASFRMNQSARVGADLATLTNSTSTAEDKKIAAKSLAGFGVEMITFRLISIATSILLGTLANKIMGRDEDDEEKEKRIDNIIKGAKTGTFTDIFSPLPIADKLVQKLGSPLLSKVEEMTGMPVSIFEPKNEEFLKSAGLFGIAADRAGQLWELNNLAITGKYTDDFGKEKTISEDNMDALKMLIAPAIMTNIGLAPSEVNTVIRYAIKNAKKKPSKTAEEREDSIERAEDKAESKEQKAEALEKIRLRTRNPKLIDAIDEKIDELEASPEEKKVIKQQNKEEKELKEELLTDPNTGEEYDNESDLKRYNKRLWNKNFGPQSDWYKEHRYEKEAESLMNKEIIKVEDKKYGYTAPVKKRRNSDGSLKRTYGRKN